VCCSECFGTLVLPIVVNSLSTPLCGVWKPTLCLVAGLGWFGTAGLHVYVHQLLSCHFILFVVHYVSRVATVLWGRLCISFICCMMCSDRSCLNIINSVIIFYFVMSALCSLQLLITFIHSILFSLVTSYFYAAWCLRSIYCGI